MQACMSSLSCRNDCKFTYNSDTVYELLRSGSFIVQYCYCSKFASGLHSIDIKDSQHNLPLCLINVNH